MDTTSGTPGGERTAPSGRGRTGRGPAERAARAERILDAAGDLILRWGYDKTTVDDIARAARVAKGTIYLHWTSRDRLFLALLRREEVAMLVEASTGYAGDTAGSPLYRVLRQITRAMLGRPLLIAVILRDMEVLGRLAAAERQRRDAGWRDGFVGYLRELRDRGLVRTDLGLAEQVHVVSAAFVGCLVVAPVMPAELALPDDVRADLVAESISRALEPAAPVAAGAAAEFERLTAAYLDGAFAAARRTYAAALGPDAAAPGPDPAERAG